jgi:hypothetical protein
MAVRTKRECVIDRVVTVIRKALLVVDLKKSMVTPIFARLRSPTEWLEALPAT